MSELTDVQRDKLVNDLRSVIHDAEELLKMSAGDASAEATELRDRVRVRLLQAKDNLHRLQETAIERAKAAGHKADDYVHDHPWQSIGVAAGFGLLVGLLIGRR
ncbi:MAG: YqjD family protein [Gammaproteobacteria bacterium]|uniref:DUF883 family protein n=1 Tax=Azohydromonas sp. TaxID=1872666 RepID=UPI002B8CFEF2|nr:DUF883 family protein [Azohydromonas sp.]HMM87044.1 DUF883 family protein [Azohydromonas sp.]